LRNSKTKALFFKKISKIKNFPEQKDYYENIPLQLFLFLFRALERTSRDIWLCFDLFSLPD